jgi:hypothetical protein
MQAVRIHRFGEPEVMALDRQIPAANEVVAASVNPVDAKMPEGKYPVVTEQDLPYVLCRDVSGQIAAVGDEVSSGDDVFAFLSPEHGGYEEFVWRGLTRWLPSQVQWTRSGRPPCRSLRVAGPLRTWWSSPASGFSLMGWLQAARSRHPFRQP